MTDTAYTPGLKLLTRCHLETQLSSGLIIAMIPSKEELVQSYTISRLPFICRYASQLSQPSYSNWSIVLTSEHSKQARRCRRSFGTVSRAIFSVAAPTQGLLQSQGALPDREGRALRRVSNTAAKAEAEEGRQAPISSLPQPRRRRRALLVPAEPLCLRLPLSVSNFALEEKLPARRQNCSASF